MVWTQQEWRAAIAGGETRNLDLKGPCAWEGSRRLALTKTLVALGNTRDGGAVIIGVDDSGIVAGLDSAQVASFDPTPIAQFVGKYFAPVPSVSVGTADLDGKTVVALHVREFEQDPFVCVKDGENEGEKLFREGDLFVRTSGAQARRAGPDELRDLLGRAVAKRGDLLLDQLRRILQGAPLAQPSVRWTDDYSEQLEKWHDLRDQFLSRTRAGAYEFLAAFPKRTEAESVTRLISAIEKARVSVAARDFPARAEPVAFNDRLGGSTEPRSSGFAATWAMFRTGLFAEIRTLSEDVHWGIGPPPVLAAGDVPCSAGEFVLFVNRLARELGWSGVVTLSVNVHRAKGRLLTSTSMIDGYRVPTFGWTASGEDVITVEKTVDLARLAGTGWKEVAVAVSEEVVAIFGATGAHLRARLMAEIDRLFS